MKIRVIAAIVLLTVATMAINVSATDCCPCPPPPCPPPCCEYKGFTPGFWSGGKNSNGIGYTLWPADYDHDELVSAVFSAYTGDITLINALKAPYNDMSTGQAKLLRQGVAAVLNAASSGGLGGKYTANQAYPWTVDQVVSAVNAALASGDDATMTALAGELDIMNNLGGG